MALNDWMLDLQCLDFPVVRHVIYVIGITCDRKFIPFYVGETSRNVAGRIGDYLSAQFNAPTDFKVGMAIRYFRSKDCQIKVCFVEASKERKERRVKESEWKIKAAKMCPRLLNDYPSHKYEADLQPDVRQRKIAEQKRRIRAWAKRFLSDTGTLTRADKTSPAG